MINSLINMLVDDYRYFKARRAAKKYKLDFSHLCKFPEQVQHRVHGETVEIDMQSGKVGLYRVSVKNVGYGTHQRDYHYKFVGYKS